MLFTEFPDQAVNYTRSELEALSAERSVERLEPFAIELAELLYSLRSDRGQSSTSATPSTTVH